MLRLRLLLGLIFTVSITFLTTIFPKIAETDPNMWTMSLGMVSIMTMPTFAITALAMFILSFFKVHTTDAGYIAYDPKNWGWKCALWLWIYDEKNCGKQISFCKAFLLMCVSTFLGIISICAIFSIGLIAWTLIQGLISPSALLQVLALSLLSIGIMIALTVPVALFYFSRKHARKNKPFLRYLFLSFSVVAGCGAYFAFPLYFVMEKRGVDLLSALLIYLEELGIAVTMVVIVIIIFCGILWLSNVWASLPNDNLFKLFYLAMKEKMCPILIAEKQAE